MPKCCQLSCSGLAALCFGSWSFFLRRKSCLWCFLLLNNTLNPKQPLPKKTTVHIVAAQLIKTSIHQFRPLLFQLTSPLSLQMINILIIACSYSWISYFVICSKYLKELQMNFWQSWYLGKAVTCFKPHILYVFGVSNMIWAQYLLL